MTLSNVKVTKQAKNKILCDLNCSKKYNKNLPRSPLCLWKHPGFATELSL